MTNLIVYCSSHGTTAKAAQLLGESLVGKVELVDLSKHKNPDLTPYDAVIIGGSIHAGMIQRKLKKFITMNHDTLLTKKPGSFFVVSARVLKQKPSLKLPSHRIYALKQFQMAYLEGSSFFQI